MLKFQQPSLGAVYLDDGRCSFHVWAPCADRLDLHLHGPSERVIPLASESRGYFQAVLDHIAPGTLYTYRIHNKDGVKERPDPASRSQPQGIHGPSQVVDAGFPWSDGGWPGVSLKDYVLYELHVGAFTQQGTFDAAIQHLPSLRDLGVTAIELMPVAQFPGSRNWGYDGVGLFAPVNSYGGPAGLKRLADACHRAGLAIVLDVVYNHLGPEGNYLGDFGPYLTDRYRTPWGPALNFDGPDSDHVRRFFVENALYWVTEYHIDALRLDAVHAIADESAFPLLREMADAVHQRAEELHRRTFLIPESAANDPRLIRSTELGGYGHDAQWSDDFHHSLHSLLTGERDGYYADFGNVAHLAAAFREGYAYTGQYSQYRRRRHGASSWDIPADRFVVFAQNHDQVGNRMLGERLSALVNFEAQKLAAGVILLSPFVPLLFMGEEYGETAPFQYFISHSDPDLVEAVRRGRKEEFAAFGWQGDVPDPQAEATFLGCKLDHTLAEKGNHQVLRAFYRELLRLRKEVPALARLSKETLEVTAFENPPVLSLRRWCGDSNVAAVFHFGRESASLSVPLPPGKWQVLLDSADVQWGGPLSHIRGHVQSSGMLMYEATKTSLVLLVQTKER